MKVSLCPTTDQAGNGKSTLLDSPGIPLGLGRFDGTEESNGESFTNTSTIIQVGRLEVIVECVRRTGARVVWVVREKGRNELVDRF